MKCSFCGGKAKNNCLNCGKVLCPNCYIIHNETIFCNDFCKDGKKPKKFRAPFLK